MRRQSVSSGTSWEREVGYSRAMRIGPLIEVAGTTAMDGDQLVGEGDAEAQTRFILQKIEQSLLELGAELKNVVRTRIYVVNIADWKAIGKAHGAFFSDIRPAATLVEVKGLVDPRLLVEIEVTAWKPEV